MRMLVAGSAVAMLLVPPSAGGQPTAPVAPRAIQRTTVAGTAPPIEGRSLVLVHLGAGTGGAGRELAVLWDVGRGAGGLEVVERFVLLPEPQQKALQRGRWQPSPADLRAIAQAWDDLRPETRGVRQVQTDVFGADGFTAEVKGDPTAEGARWVVRQTYLFAPAPGVPRPSQEVNVLAATSVEQGVTTGRYLSVTVAAAPVPMPIRLAGTFELIPLPAASWWVRLLDAFRGCNRDGRP